MNNGPGGPEGSTAASLEGKYLIFRVADQELGIRILKVREIVGMMPITPVPGAPSHLKGVINLRGKIIPVADLRVRLGMAGSQYSERSCIIVVEVGHDGKAMPMGVVVDGVSEVLNLRAEEIEEAPRFGSALERCHILGMVSSGGRVKILVDIDGLLSSRLPLANHLPSRG